MKNNKTLWSIIVALLFITIGISIFSIYQHKSKASLMQQFEREKEQWLNDLNRTQMNTETKNVAAYIIFIKEKTIDQSELNIYAKEAPAGLKGHNITTRAVYGRNQVLEGADVEGVAILEFPSYEEAKAWYENPIYQKAKEHRLKGGLYRAILVDGINK